ncbi:phage tail protein, partial [uncultured Dubosiella sp.]|uniref:phage tail protein n=1 Tax=uncultured Dubosiella sp. TaxID=1937011 RepID=UPI002730C3BE
AGHEGQGVALEDNAQGVGKELTMNLVYGREIKGIKKTSDITDLYTAIYPHGGTPEGSDVKIDISGVEHTEKDKDGRVEYFTSGPLIYAPLARDRFPSYMAKSADRFILVHWDCDVTDKEVLYSRALAELKKNCTPKVTYEIDGYADTGIGDTVRITDEEYNPILYLEARVTEQVRSITDESRNKTIYSNVEVLKSEVDSSLMARVEALIKESKTYIGQIMSDNGIQFVNGQGSTTLTAQVIDGVIDIADQYQISWKKDGVQLATTKTIVVQSADFGAQAVYGFEATKGGKVYARAEVTLTNVHDGVTPEPLYLHIRYSNDGGKTFTGNSGKTEGKWMGQYSDHLEADSEKPSDYTWAQIRGDDGQSLVSMTREFYLSTSQTELQGGSWSATPPAFEAAKFLWVRWKAVYENPSSVGYSEPELDGTWAGTLQAIDLANQAVSSADDASKSAADAAQKAGEAVGKAEAIEKEIEPIKTGIQEAKDAAEEAKQDVADATQQILVDISAEYATKSEMSDIEGDLQTQITANADGLKSKVSNTEYQQNKDAIDAELLKQNQALQTAQSNLAELQSEQSEANQKLTKAEADLKAAKDAVTALENDQATTTEQLNAAKTALSAAQQAVDKAQADVTQAKKDIATAQGQISGIQDGITDLTSRVTTAETGIEQNSQAIALKASKTEVNTAIEGAKAYTDSQIKLEAGKITQSVNSVSTKVDKLTSQKQETYYYQSTSNTALAGGSRSTTKPPEAAGKYIWQKFKFTFVDGSTSETSPVCMTGAQGGVGAAGKGVKSVATTYQAGTSGTTAPTGTWATAVPAVSPGQYLWTRTITTYTDNTTNTGYSVSYIGKNGGQGPKGDQGIAGKDAIIISYDSPNGLEFTESKKSLTITAKVFKGGIELTDAQVNALGAIKWYQVGVTAAIASGKTLTLTAPKEVYATLEN